MRTELHVRLQENSNMHKDEHSDDIARLEAALTASTNCQRELETALHKAREESEQTKRDVAGLENALTDSQREAAELVRSLASAEAASASMQAALLDCRTESETLERALRAARAAQARHESEYAEARAHTEAALNASRCEAEAQQQRLAAAEARLEQRAAALAGELASKNAAFEEFRCSFLEWYAEQLQVVACNESVAARGSEDAGAVGTGKGAAPARVLLTQAHTCTRTHIRTHHECSLYRAQV